MFKKKLSSLAKLANILSIVYDRFNRGRIALVGHARVKFPRTPPECKSSVIAIVNSFGEINVRSKDESQFQ